MLNDAKINQNNLNEMTRGKNKYKEKHKAFQRKRIKNINTKTNASETANSTSTNKIR